MNPKHFPGRLFSLLSIVSILFFESPAMSVPRGTYSRVNPLMFSTALFPSCEFVNHADVCALSTYGRQQFVSVVSKEGLFGVQFHLEKSREPGIRLLKNFIELWVEHE